MLKSSLVAWRGDREAAGFAASAAFVGLASVRDVYLGGLFQRWSPLDVALVAFLLCSVVFLPIALARSPRSLRLLAQHPRELVWINATSALAWIAFFYALRTIEPLLAQILFSGVGPLSVGWIDRLVAGSRPADPRGRLGGPSRLGLSGALGLAAAVVLGGLSGAGPQPVGPAALGIALAVGAGIAISVNTVLCRQMNDAGVEPVALVAVRFPGAVALAVALALASGHDFAPLFSAQALRVVGAASLLLIVFPIWVNQVGISLASPLTVRVVLAGAPVLIFLLEALEGRLSPSPYSLVTAVLYGAVAVLIALRRGRGARPGRPGSPAPRAPRASGPARSASPA